jgi:uncharacterized SAM-binding protein YcdF (DUF218 family)
VVYILAKLAWAVLRPSSLLVVLATLGLLLSWTRWRRLSRALLLVGVGGLLALLVLPLDQWATRPLEDRFSRPDPPPAHVDGIIMLGGALEAFVMADRGSVSFTSAGERVAEFVALARRYPQARLAFTGGTGDTSGFVPPEADVMRPALADLGLPVERVTFESASRTTWENAVFSHRLIQPKLGEIWLLVTSASHMPRSVGTFRAAGWRVVPWPVGYKTTQHHTLKTLAAPFGERLARFDWAVHEWLGMVAYRAIGRSSALFPAPEAG